MGVSCTVPFGRGSSRISVLIARSTTVLPVFGVVEFVTNWLTALTFAVSGVQFPMRPPNHRGAMGHAFLMHVLTLFALLTLEHPSTQSETSFVPTALVVNFLGGQKDTKVHPPTATVAVTARTKTNLWWLPRIVGRHLCMVPSSSAPPPPFPPHTHRPCSHVQVYVT